MNLITVRQAVFSDLETLVPLFDRYRQFQGQPADVAAARAFLRARFDHGESVVFIAHAGPLAVGFAQLYPSFSSTALARVFILNDLFVDEAGRRQGVAAGLLAALETYAWAHGAARVSLNVAHDNPQAQALYEAQGWRRDAQFRAYHRFPTPPDAGDPPDSGNRLPESLETSRLHIRVARPGDGAAFHAAVRDSMDELSPWLGWVTPMPSPEAAEANCQRAHARYLRNEDLMVFFFLKQGGTLIGGSGLHDADWQRRSFEVGYWCRSGHGGQGLMTEGVRALSDHALQALRANRVFLTVDDKNVKSWRLAERAGFLHEGTLGNERFDLQGRLRNTRVYARTATGPRP